SFPETASSSGRGHTNRHRNRPAPAYRKPAAHHTAAVSYLILMSFSPSPPATPAPAIPSFHPAFHIPAQIPFFSWLRLLMHFSPHSGNTQIQAAVYPVPKPAIGTLCRGHP